MGQRGESYYRRERYRAWVKLQQSHEDMKEVISLQQQLGNEMIMPEDLEVSPPRQVISQRGSRSRIMKSITP